MTDGNQGFQGWARRTDAAVPPGQYVTDDFPVLTAGPDDRGRP